MSGEVIKFPVAANPFQVGGLELQGTSVWVCLCSSQLFRLTPDGPECAACGKLSEWELGRGCDDEPGDEA
jgi:hypothetical protein